MSVEVPESILNDYNLAGAALTPIVMGHINRTFVVEHRRGRFILQRLNPIFMPELHYDLDAVTRHLQKAGLLTPLLIRTQKNQLWCEDENKAVWRLLTFVEGVVPTGAVSAPLCFKAGVLVGRFHAAVSDLNYEFKNKRVIHEPPRHMAHLRATLDGHGSHRHFAAIAKVAEQILRRGEKLPSFNELPKRVVHGDLKLTNIMFAENGEAVALLDLDTFTRVPLAFELGDAWRSWCNPFAEDSPQATFDLDYLKAAVSGYAVHAKALLTAVEIESLGLGVEAIALELAARFAADALTENYFGWDSTRYASRAEHNLRRAQSQLQIAEAVAEKRKEIEAVIQRAFQA